MFDYKEPIGMSLSVLGVVLIVSFGVLYVARPSWILKVDEKKGTNTISWPVLAAYALTFALVCSTATFLVKSSQRGSREPTATQSFPPSSAFPSLFAAKAYTS